MLPASLEKGQDSLREGLLRPRGGSSEWTWALGGRKPAVGRGWSSGEATRRAVAAGAERVPLCRGLRHTARTATRVCAQGFAYCLIPTRGAAARIPCRTVPALALPSSWGACRRSAPRLPGPKSSEGRSGLPKGQPCPSLWFLCPGR